MSVRYNLWIGRDDVPRKSLYVSNDVVFKMISWNNQPEGMSNDGAHATHKTAAPMRNNDIKQKKLYRIDLKKKNEGITR